MRQHQGSRVTEHSFEHIQDVLKEVLGDWQAKVSEIAKLEGQVRDLQASLSRVETELAQAHERNERANNTITSLKLDKEGLEEKSKDSVRRPDIIEAFAKHKVFLRISQLPVDPEPMPGVVTPNTIEFALSRLLRDLLKVEVSAIFDKSKVEFDRNETIGVTEIGGENPYSDEYPRFRGHVEFAGVKAGSITIEKALLTVEEKLPPVVVEVSSPAAIEDEPAPQPDPLGAVEYGEPLSDEIEAIEPTAITTSLPETPVDNPVEPARLLASAVVELVSEASVTEESVSTPAHDDPDVVAENAMPAVEAADAESILATDVNAEPESLVVHDSDQPAAEQVTIETEPEHRDVMPEAELPAAPIGAVDADSGQPQPSLLNKEYLEQWNWWVQRRKATHGKHRYYLLLCEVLTKLQLSQSDRDYLGVNQVIRVEETDRKQMKNWRIAQKGQPSIFDNISEAIVDPDARTRFSQVWDEMADISTGAERVNRLR